MCLSHSFNRLTKTSSKFPELFVRLPEDVAKLGRAGAQLSCMSLAFRRGVWRPIGSQDMDGYVVANVYPP